MAAPTFNWTGTGTAIGERVYYSSFNLSNVKYSLGDYVYLLPEDEGSALYIAKIRRAFESTAADEAQRLCIEVQWLERRSSMPDAFQARMHERELVESDMWDTNLVGCIDHKALVVLAPSYEEACKLILPEEHDSDWYFCRGMYDTATGTFKPFPGLHARCDGFVPVCSSAPTANGAAPFPIRNGSLAAHANGRDDYSDDDLLQPSNHARRLSDPLLGFTHPGTDSYGGTNSDSMYGAVCSDGLQGVEDSPALLVSGSAVDPRALVDMLHRSHANGGPMPVATLTFAESAPPSLPGRPGPAPLGSASRHARKPHAPLASHVHAQQSGGQIGSAPRRIGVPGRVCAECGATQTPQWREGPLGPKTLCNACGVRFHRQNKAKANKRYAAERRPSPIPRAAQPPKKPRLPAAGPSGSRQSARQAQRIAAARAEQEESDEYDYAAARHRGGGGGGSGSGEGRGRGEGELHTYSTRHLVRVSCGRRAREEGEQREVRPYGEVDLDGIMQGIRREKMQRTQTSEAADLLQTFKLGPAPGHRLSDGSDGQLLPERGLAADMLLDGRGTGPGVPGLLKGAMGELRRPPIPAGLQGPPVSGGPSNGHLDLARLGPFQGASGPIGGQLDSFRMGPQGLGQGKGFFDGAGRRLKGGLPVHLQGRDGMQVTASGDSWHTSDSTEEVAFDSLRAAAPVTGGMAPDAAAVQLGSLEDWAPELAGYSKLFEAIPELMSSLPEEQAGELLAANLSVDAAAREAKAADAAVQAVSQVLAVKRQAAEHARAAANQQLASLRQLMLSLSTQFGVPGAALSSSHGNDLDPPPQGMAEAATNGTAPAVVEQYQIGYGLEGAAADADPVAAAVAAAVAGVKAKQEQEEQQRRQQQQQAESTELLLDATAAAQLLESGPADMDMEAVIGADWACLPTTAAELTGQVPTTNGHSSLEVMRDESAAMVMPQLLPALQPVVQLPPQQARPQFAGKQRAAQQREAASLLHGVGELFSNVVQQASGGPETTPVAA